MSFINALPRPIMSDEDRDELESPTEQAEILCQNSITFVNYDVTSETVRLLCRDLSLPFEFLKYFANTRPIDVVDTDPSSSLCSIEIVGKKAKLTEIKLKILYRTEKSQSLSNMPLSLAKFLEGLSFHYFLELLPTFNDVMRSWVKGIQQKQMRKQKNQFYATPRIKVFDIQKLTNELARIFIEGFNFYGRPNFSDLNYYEFQKFLDLHSIPYAGPFKTCFNGQNLVSVFVAGEVNALRFFNNNTPVFGIFEFELTSRINYENLPPWFLDPPFIHNFAINRMISNFERMTFV